jgi:hypothetical protein
MISANERQPAKIASDFYYWANLLAGKLIVNIIVYVDESGTHDFSSTEIGAKVAVLAGYGGFADDWVKFCGAWQTTLNQYGIKKFHFSQFSDKRNSADDINWPYYGWSEDDRHDFLFKLASIAGSRARIPFAAAFRLAHFQSDPDIKDKLREMGLTDAQINGPNIINLSIFAECFESFLQESAIRLPKFSESISFVFDDRKGNRDWAIAGYDVHRIFKEKDNRLIRPPTFGDTYNDVPLQAADMIAYRAHQIWENEHRTKQEIFEPSALDCTMWGNFRNKEEMKDYFRRLFMRNGLLVSPSAASPSPTQTSLVQPPWRQTL